MTSGYLKNGTKQDKIILISYDLLLKMATFFFKAAVIIIFIPETYIFFTYSSLLLSC